MCVYKFNKKESYLFNKQAQRKISFFEYKHIKYKKLIQRVLINIMNFTLEYN